MKIKQITEAKYSDPKIEKINSLIDEGEPKEGYMFMFPENGDMYVINHISFDTDEGEDYVGVEFAGADDGVAYSPEWFYKNVQVFQTKRVI